MAAALDLLTTVLPVVSMDWMTRWSSTIFCLARSMMLSSTEFCSGGFVDEASLEKGGALRARSGVGGQDGEPWSRAGRS